jgi:hypothetical protein
MGQVDVDLAEKFADDVSLLFFPLGVTLAKLLHDGIKEFGESCHLWRELNLAESGHEILPPEAGTIFATRPLSAFFSMAMSILDCAKAKLQKEFAMDELPKLLDDPTWMVIKQDFGLTLKELIAVKNAKFGTPPYIDICQSKDIDATMAIDRR